MEKGKLTPNLGVIINEAVLAVFRSFMKKVNLTAKAGLIINLLVMLLYVYGLRDEFSRDASSDMIAGLLIIGFLLSLAGLTMLARGNPAGGIVGAAGSALFIPAGLVCMIGCFQARDKLHFADYATGAPTKPASSETPLAAYEFTDERLRGLLMLLFSAAMGCYFLAHGEVAGAGSGFLLASLGIAIMARSNNREQWKAYALFRDRLECLPGAWSEPVSIPYADILAVELYWHKARLSIKRPGGEEKIMLRFSGIPERKRNEAREIFAAKMRELGVLREA